jgi:hypothetical protein
LRALLEATVVRIVVACGVHLPRLTWEAGAFEQAASSTISKSLRARRPGTIGSSRASSMKRP